MNSMLILLWKIFAGTILLRVSHTFWYHQCGQNFGMCGTLIFIYTIHICRFMASALLNELSSGTNLMQNTWMLSMAHK